MRNVVVAVAGLSFLIAGTLPGEPQKIPHGAVELISSVQSIRPGSDFRVGLLFRLEAGWHIYWKNPGDSGQTPRLTWTLPEQLKAGEIEWPAPERLPVGPLLDYGYEGTVLLPIVMSPTAQLSTNPSEELKLSLRVLVCKETCMPGKANLTIKLPVSEGTPAAVKANEPLFASASAARPRVLPSGWKVSGEQAADSIVLSVTGAPSSTVASFIPAQAHQIENAAPQHLSSKSDGFELKLKKAQQASLTDRLQGLLTVEDGDRTVAYTVNARIAAPPPLSARQKLPEPGVHKANESGVLAILLLAFGGGLVLNLMPCVFPVLSLKILSLLDQSGGERGAIRISAGIYTLGVLVSFWVLVAVLLALRGAGRRLGWGFQLQAPGFVAFLVCLLFVLGLSLLGTFEIGTSLMGVGSSLTERGRYSSSFFTGVLATVVATPCTAPFMGAAVGFALGQSALVCVLVFTVMAIGLAAPFLLLSVAPGLAKLLPRPGAWMETLKQVLAFPVFATVIWLVWVLGQQSGVNDIAILLFALLILSVAVWMAGRWHESRAVLVAALVLGFVVTAWTCRDVGLNRENLVRAESMLPPANGGLRWETFTPEKLANYRAQGKPVLIDFTAAWCLTCQVNDRVVFHSQEVEKHLNKSPIVLLRADWTSYDPAITELLAKFGRSGIPFYVLYGTDQNTPPLTLPDGVLTPSAFLNNLRKLNL